MCLPEKVKIVEMLGDRAEGGYGEVRHVRIVRMAGIPIDCDFAAKKSKAAKFYVSAKLPGRATDSMCDYVSVKPPERATA